MLLPQMPIYAHVFESISNIVVTFMRKSFEISEEFKSVIDTAENAPVNNNLNTSIKIDQHKDDLPKSNTRWNVMIVIASITLIVLIYIKLML